MSNFPDCMKSIEKMGTKLDTFTATKQCSCLFYQLAPTALLLFDKKHSFFLFLFLLRCNFASKEWPASMGSRLAI